MIKEDFPVHILLSVFPTLFPLFEGAQSFELVFLAAVEQLTDCVEALGADDIASLDREPIRRCSRVYLLFREFGNLVLVLGREESERTEEVLFRRLSGATGAHICRCFLVALPQS